MMRFDQFNLWVVVGVDGGSSKHQDCLNWLLSKLRDKHMYKNILSTEQHSDTIRSSNESKMYQDASFIMSLHVIFVSS